MLRKPFSQRREPTPQLRGASAEPLSPQVDEASVHVVEAAGREAHRAVVSRTNMAALYAGDIDESIKQSSTRKNVSLHFSQPTLGH